LNNLVWLRNDLRVEDNPALSYAAKNDNTEVVFIVCEQQWQQHNEAPQKIGLKADVLVDVATQLAQFNIPLHVLHCDDFNDCPALLLAFCQHQKTTDIWFNLEIPIDEQVRDKAVIEALNSIHVTSHPCDWDLLLPKPIYNQQGLPFKVFTPFYKSWLKQLEATPQHVVPTPKVQNQSVNLAQQNIGQKVLSWKKPYREDLWKINTIQTEKKMHSFLQHKMHSYIESRNIPAIAGTSTLSPYLALGMIGPRHLFTMVQLECAAQGTDWRTNDWLRELAWRDFYKQLMWHFPLLSKERAFKANTEVIIWSQDTHTFNAWCNGKTGFPIVDAAMRQLQQTGWMHNRLRMITASFLTKILFIDWRKGEQFFMQNLIDGDFASNNGGWQWSASTGCDSAPYFRIFNPLRQSEKFDPNGDFIRRFVPELASLDKKNIHNPNQQQRESTHYPNPVVDYVTARKYAILRFEEIIKTR